MAGSVEFVLHLVTISLSQCSRVPDLVFKAFSCWLLPVFCFIFCSIPLGTITLGKRGCLLVAYCVCFYGSLLSDAFFTLHIPAVFMCEYCSPIFSFMCFSMYLLWMAKLVMIFLSSEIIPIFKSPNMYYVLLKWHVSNDYSAYRISETGILWIPNILGTIL